MKKTSILVLSVLLFSCNTNSSDSSCGLAMRIAYPKFITLYGNYSINETKTIEDCKKVKEAGEEFLNQTKNCPNDKTSQVKNILESLDCSIKSDTVALN